MIYYEAIVGSRSHNINLCNSDWDFVTCSDEKKQSTYDPNNFDQVSHLIHISPQGLLDKIFLKLPVAFYPQILFPKSYLMDNYITSYLKENREDIVFFNGKRLYEAYLLYIERVVAFNKTQAPSPKKLAYGCLYANLLKQYAELDMSFEELVVINGEWREWLLDLRKTKLVEEKHLTKFNEMIKDLSDLEKIYEKRQNEQVIKYHKDNLKEIFLQNNIQIQG